MSDVTQLPAIKKFSIWRGNTLRRRIYLPTYSTADAKTIKVSSSKAAGGRALVAVSFPLA